MRVTDFGEFQQREPLDGWEAGTRARESAGTVARTNVGDLEADEGAGVDSVGATTGTAGTLAIGGTQNGFVHTANDRDWYAVTLVAGQSYTFTLNGGTLTDPYLEIYNSSGSLIGYDDDFGSGVNAALRWTATQSGTYYINAQAFPASNLTGSYTLTAATSAPASPLDAIDYHYTMPTTNISIWFAGAGYTNSSGDTAVRAWTQPEINAVMAALGTYTAIAPLTFSVAASQGAATWIFSLPDLTGNTLGYFAVGSQYAAFDPTVPNFTAGLVAGGSSWVTVIHEAGHGLGMAHPHDNGAENYGPDNSEVMQGVLSAFNEYGTFNLNQGVFTTMTYNDGWALSGFGATPSSLSGGQSTPMALDIALIQQRYGVNATTGLGNSVYTMALASSSYIAIWDVSGTDAISYGGNGNTTIDLRAATLLNAIGGGGDVSFVQGVHGGFTIANGVVIEDATTGGGEDTLIGNDAANVLSAGSATDTLSGNGGNDTLVSGGGNDLINGGAGMDTSVYTVASTASTWVRDPTGSWTVGSSDTVSSVEYLQFTDRTVFLDRPFATFSGDGTSDVLFHGVNGAVVSWSVLGTALQSGNYIASVAPAEWTALGIGDFNGDGRDDVVWRQSTGQVLSWQMNGATISSAQSIASLGAEWSFLAVADLGGDGRDDIVWRNTSGLIYSWETNASGALATSGAITSLSTDWSLEGFGDFDSDGRDDFLWRNSNSNQTVMWDMDGRTIAAGASTSAQVGAEWGVQGIGDFNGDGRDDILWMDTGGAVVIWHMNGATLLGGGYVASLDPSEWSVGNIGDYNGDGKDDILWQNSNGTVYDWIMNGTTITTAGALATIAPGQWDIIGGG